MVKPNFGFQKRQRELQKKEKKEEKLKRKAALANPDGSVDPAEGEETDQPPADDAKPGANAQGDA